jgi:hypothetical protein
MGKGLTKRLIEQREGDLTLVREIYEIYHESWVKERIQILEEELKELEERYIIEQLKELV